MKNPLHFWLPKAFTFFVPHGIVAGCRRVKHQANLKAHMKFMEERQQRILAAKSNGGISEHLDPWDRDAIVDFLIARGIPREPRVSG